MKIGIFIGRMQPLHLGHEAVIIDIFKNNDFVLIILGSSGVINEENIFSDKIRKNILKNFLVKNIFDKNKNKDKEKEKYKILKLKDYKTDEEWVINLSNKILNFFSKKNIDHINIKDCTLTFYGGDLKNDYAIGAIKNFKYLIKYKNINFKEINRDNFYVKYFGKKLKISSSKIRKALKNKDLELIKKMVNKNVYKKILKLLKIK